MMEEARAFAPGNVSCVFRVVSDTDPGKMHSMGMGFTVADGVVARVCRASSPGILLNGAATDFPTVACVLRTLTSEPLLVQFETSLPMSSGFGMSGACALSAAYAVDALLGLGGSREDLGMVAHVAEVENLTGLGDVCGQFHGGFLAKLRPGHPLAAERLCVQVRAVFYRYFGPIHTAEVLRDPLRREHINRAGDEAVEELRGLIGVVDVDFDKLVILSRKFAVDSGLLRHPDVADVVDGVIERGGQASMIMLGNAVFSTIPFPGSTETSLSMRPAELL